MSKGVDVITTENIVISIIIPVYRVEKYICRCLNSVLSQTFKEFECILVVDECPSDNSSVICDDYANKDSRFVVVHRENKQGIASAREMGLKLARGNYILYVDADDYIDSCMLDKMYDKAINENADMVICGIFAESKLKIRTISHTFTEVDSNLRMRLLRNFESLLIYDKLVKKDVYLNCFVNYGIPCEDLVVVIQAIYYSKIIRYINEPYYHYRINTYIRKRRINLWANGMYENFLSVYEFLKANNNNDIAEFEPFISCFANNMKVVCMCVEKYRAIDVMHTVYPESLNYILRKKAYIGTASKVLLLLAKHGFILPFKIIEKVFNIIEKILIW